MLVQGFEQLERETGFEPATSTLARSHSTTELLPLDFMSINEGVPEEQTRRRGGIPLIAKCAMSGRPGRRSMPSP